MADRIESRKNERYKAWLKISRNGGAARGAARELVFLEGLRLCEDAARSGAWIETVLLAASAGSNAAALAQELSGRADCFVLTDALFAGLCDTINPQGIALICRAPVLRAPGSPPDPAGLYLIADGLQDPGNLGSMIRTADAFAFSAVLVTDGTVWPMNSKVIRAAMGSCFHVPIISFDSLASAAAWLALSGIGLLAADPRGQPLYPGDRPGGALVIGNEAHGLSSQARELASRLVSIPMPGRAESLNAAAAAAILCHALMVAHTAEMSGAPDPDAGRT